ncbi:hypothetical protein BDZ97DRAFT_2080804, partial [Flammula alnicola]
MSIRLPAPSAISNPISDDSDNNSTASESEDDNDQTWDDWVSDSIAQQQCKSLFDETVLSSVDAALAYDKETHQFSLDDTCKALSLDFHGRVRLINYIRKNKPTRADVAKLQSTESWFTSDEYLVPVVENDPLLQSYSEDWTDSEDENLNDVDPNRKIKALEKKLAIARQSLGDYRALIADKLNISREVENLDEAAQNQ